MAAIEPLTEHVPVLPSEVLEYLRVPVGGYVVDATVGLGGHAALILDRIGPTGTLIGLDVDEDHLKTARQRLSSWPNVRLFRENFANIEALLQEIEVTAVDTVLADLGVSSRQLNDPHRGFSINMDGPLDMRLDDQSKTTAADLVNKLSESELADLIYHNSQERFSRRIAKAIHQARRESRITTTQRLTDTICQAVGIDPKNRKSKIHPATRTFMALRIAVNHELDALDRFLQAVPNVLKPGGRAGIISFHSLEDGRCKRAFRQMKDQKVVNIITKKPITASSEERHNNPRSRSAKLRVIEKSEA